MYIIELFIDIFKGKKYKKHSYNPLDNNPNALEENSEDCEHLFLPLDSNKEHFACKYCGLIVTKNKLKNKNIFENNSF